MMNRYLAPIRESGLLGAELDRQAKAAMSRFGEFLVSEGIITPKHLEDAIFFQKRDRGRRIGDILVDMGVVTLGTIEAALFRRLGIPAVELRGFDIDPEAVRQVPKQLAQRFNLIPCMRHGGRLVVAAEKPLDNEALKLLHFSVGCPIELVLAAKDDIELAIMERYADDAAPDHGAIGGDSDQDEAVIDLLESTILYGVKSRAAEIRILPEGDHADIIFHVDGELMKLSSLDRKLLPGMINYIRSIGQMDQDQAQGSAWLDDGERSVELGLAVIPGPDGEQVEIRILEGPGAPRSTGPQA